MSVTVATGATDPSGRARSVVSTGTHDPSDRCTRTGTAVEVNVDVPSGFAKTCVFSLRPARTSTRWPHRFAIRPADRPSGRTVSQAGEVAALGCRFASAGAAKGTDASNPA